MKTTQHTDKGYSIMKAVIITLALIFACSVQAATVNYTYDLAGRLTQAQYSNGTTITYTYDPAGNMLSREVVTPLNQTNALTQASSVDIEWAKQILNHETLQMFKQQICRIWSTMNQEQG